MLHSSTAVRRLALLAVSSLALSSCTAPMMDAMQGADRVGTEPSATQQGVAGQTENFPDVAKLDYATIRADLSAGRYSSVALTRAYLDRIAAMNHQGPDIRALIAVMPDALEQAKRLDAERAAGKIRGPLHGIPIIVKDNIEVAGPVATTAGSLALASNVTNRDAPLIARLRDAGAIILGKANLSEWANIRSGNSTSGWSAVGGLTRNPHGIAAGEMRNTCGSSAGSGAGVAAGFAPLAVGTETDGSIICPAANNGLVGLKPTLGLVSRRHIVPISTHQDTAGPMTRCVADSAAMLTAMAGSDPQDAATMEADGRKSDYLAALSPDALKGKRIGAYLPENTAKGEHTDLYRAALARMEAAGATIVLIPDMGFSEADWEHMNDAEFITFLVDLRAEMDAYLGGLPAGLIPVKTLADLVAFNTANADTELAYFGQEFFELALTMPAPDSDEAKTARADALRLAGEQGIDRLLATHNVDFIVAQSNAPAWLSTLGKGDAFTGPSASGLPAIAGYPHLTVPMGFVRNLPVGISFIGPKWADGDVLNAGYAFEMASGGCPAWQWADSATFTRAQ